MTHFFRAAGLTAVAFSIATGAAFAGSTPSGANGQVDGRPITASFADHETTPVVAGDVAENGLATMTESENTAVSAPVSQHALASIEAVVASAQDDDSAGDLSAKSLPELVSLYASSEVPDAELECLATAVYYEAKSESLGGQLAVAEVIINRTTSGRFPASVCGVVKQRGQFSFVRAGRLPSVPRASRDWREAVAISHIARQDLAKGAAPRALFFHARRVSPNWNLTKVAMVGNHVFYR